MPLSTVTSRSGWRCARQVDDGRRQPIAVHRAIGHDVVQVGRCRAEHGQAAQRHGAGGGAVAVVVGDDADAPALRRCDRRAAAPPRRRPAGSAAPAGGPGRRRDRRRWPRRARPAAAPAGGARRPARARTAAGAGRRGFPVASQGLQQRARIGRAPTPERALQDPGRLERPARRGALAAQGQPDRLAFALLAQQVGQRAGVERVPCRLPAVPVLGQRTARAAARRRPGRSPRSPLDACPQPLSQKELTADSPRASRAALTGCSCQRICASFCSRRSSRASASRGSQVSMLRPITRSSDAVRRCASDSCARYQRSGAP